MAGLTKKYTKKQKAEKQEDLKKEEKYGTVVPVDAYPMLLHKLRETSLTVRSGDNWIRGLSDKNILSLYDLIIKGTPDEIIIEHAKNAWNCPVSIFENADRASIRLFRNKIVGNTVHSLQAVTLEEKKFRKNFVDKARSLLRQFDPIAEMISVVQEQKRRVQMGMDQELLAESLSPMVSSEISSYNRMLHDLVSKLQSIGLIEEKPVEQVLHMNTTFNSVVELVAKTGENKMLSIASDFMSKVDELAIEMQVNKDGTFTQVEEVSTEIIIDKDN